MCGVGEQGGRDLRGSDDHLLGGDRLGSGAVQCPPQSPIHGCVPGPRFRGSAINTLLQLLDRGGGAIDMENQYG